jgi:hypothetical protein
MLSGSSSSSGGVGGPTNYFVTPTTVELNWVVLGCDINYTRDSHLMYIQRVVPMLVKSLVPLLARPPSQGKESLLCGIQRKLDFQLPEIS